MVFLWAIAMRPMFGVGPWRQSIVARYYDTSARILLPGFLNRQNNAIAEERRLLFFAASLYCSYSCVRMPDLPYHNTTDGLRTPTDYA